MKVIVDRIEGDFAVVELEDGTILDMPIGLIPEDAKEGDVISISIDKKETKSRKERMKNLVEDMWE